MPKYAFGSIVLDTPRTADPIETAFADAADAVPDDIHSSVWGMPQPLAYWARVLPVTPRHYPRKRRTGMLPDA